MESRLKISEVTEALKNSDIFKYQLQCRSFVIAVNSVDWIVYFLLSETVIYISSIIQYYSTISVSKEIPFCFSQDHPIPPPVALV
jgi:hypothetical protein